jgi:hypothetical protein
MIKGSLPYNLNFIAMGKSLLLLLLSFSVFSVSSQITYKNNCIRSGDETVKEQVEFKDPGRSGENVIWNFSELKAINSEYKLSSFMKLTTAWQKATGGRRWDGRTK